MSTSFNWHIDDRIAQLQSMRKKGWSAKQIAFYFEQRKHPGETITRNAVLGKAFRVENEL